MMTPFAAKLRELREARGLPPPAVDELLDVMRGSCTNWENGFSIPEPEILEEIAAYFHVKVSDLTGE